jgi:hypothetical protein
MNNKETTKLVALVAQLWPSMKINDFTADAWHPALADLPLDAATTAVMNLVKFKIGYIGISDIRRQVVEDAGLGHVEEGIAYDMAAKVGLNSGTGARALPGAVQAAYWQMGGSPAFDGDAGMVRARWNKIYAACCEARTKELVTGDLGQAIVQAREHVALAEHASQAAPRQIWGA